MAWTDEEMKIAEWMLEKYNERQYLPHATACRVIRQKFGEQHVYKNKRQKWAINEGVLEAFNKLTPEAVWSGCPKIWRARRLGDPQDTRGVG